MKTTLERFMSKVEVSDGCWLWKGGASGRYGSFWYQGRVHHAHRASWALAHGDELPPDDIVVCHACDVPLCVRPSHLFLGTQLDNMQDAARKGRSASNANGRWKGGYPMHRARQAVAV